MIIIVVMYVEILLILAIIPSIIISFIVYFSDKKEKEPIGKLILAFMLGVASIILTLVVSVLFKITDIEVADLNMFDTFIYSFILIAAIEEISKWLCGYILLRKNSDFNYMYDGIVYYSFVALGFATIENILYAFESDLSVVLTRAVTTVPAHVFFGISCGYFFALAIREKNKRNNRKKIKNLVLSIIVPILLHGFYDFCLLTGSYLLLMVYLVFIVSLYVISISNASRMQKIDHMLTDTNIYCRRCGNVITSSICEKCGNKIEE